MITLALHLLLASVAAAQQPADAWIDARNGEFRRLLETQADQACGDARCYYDADGRLHHRTRRYHRDDVSPERDYLVTEFADLEIKQRRYRRWVEINIDPHGDHCHIGYVFVRADPDETLCTGGTPSDREFEIPHTAGSDGLLSQSTLLIPYYTSMLDYALQVQRQRLLCEDGYPPCKTDPDILLRDRLIKELGARRAEYKRLVNSLSPAAQEWAWLKRRNPAFVAQVDGYGHVEPEQLPEGFGAKLAEALRRMREAENAVEATEKDE